MNEIEKIYILKCLFYFQYLESMGYCPQKDSLNHSLTGRELLITVAHLRGINDVGLINNFLDIFGMKPFELSLQYDSFYLCYCIIFF